MRLSRTIGNTITFQASYNLLAKLEKKSSKRISSEKSLRFIMQEERNWKLIPLPIPQSTLKASSILLEEELESIPQLNQVK